LLSNASHMEQTERKDYKMHNVLVLLDNSRTESFILDDVFLHAI